MTIGHRPRRGQRQCRILVSPDVVVAIVVEHDVDHERQPLEADGVVLASDLGEIGSGLDGIQLAVDIDLLQLVEQDHAGNLAVPRKLSELGRILINDSPRVRKVIQGSERSLVDGAL